MPRIAKSEVNAALKTVATAIIKAGGDDGRTSRAEMKDALKSLPRAQRPLADIFFKFVDHRDFKKGAQVTAKDVTRAVDYAKTHMIAKYDLNSNGLSKDEISKMSLTGKRAVDLAKALKGAGATDDSAGRLDAQKLGAAVARFASTANYISESDYSPEYLSAAFPAGHDLNGHNVMTAFRAPLERLFDGNDGSFPGDYTFEAYSATEGKEFLKDLSASSPDDDASQKESAKAFGEITTLLKANLTDLQVFKIGPKDDQGKLAVDHGLYGQLVVGRTADGKVAAILMGDVET